MLYIIRAEVDPTAEVEAGRKPEEIKTMLEMWQAHNPVGMYFSLSQREMTVILDAPNEDAFSHALNRTWTVTKSYPRVSSVMDAAGFQDLFQRMWGSR